MSTSDLSLAVNRNAILPFDKILALIEIAFAPMLLLQFLTGGIEQNAGAVNNNPVISALGVLYIGGWICGAIGMFRQKMYGETAAAKIVFAAQMVFLAGAFMFSVMETFSINYTTGGTFFFVCDMCYPASHLFMFVVGVFVLRAKRLKKITRFAPFFVGAALPATIILGGFVGTTAGMILFGGLTAIGLGMIGYAVYSNQK